MADEHDYGLIEPFGVDDGELDGLSPQMCFTLGVEWQMFRQQLEGGGPFVRQVHTANVTRLKAMCERQGRSVSEHWVHDDYEGWRLLRVT